MDIGFLILVVAPLCVYLVLILYSVKDIESSDTPSASAHAPTSDAFAAPDVPAVMELAASASESAPFSASTAVTESAATRELDTSEPTRLESIQDTLTAKAPPPPTAATEIAATAENADLPAAEIVSPAIPLTENTLGSETDAAAAPASIANTAPADIFIITEPVADESPELLDDAETAAEEDLPDAPLQFPAKGSPKFVFDYRGRLWVEKKNRGFFKQLRRPQLPPDDPNAR